MPKWVTVLFLVTVACLSVALVCAAREYLLHRQPSTGKTLKPTRPPLLAQAIPQAQSIPPPEVPAPKEEAKGLAVPPPTSPPTTPETAEPSPPETPANVLEVVLTFDDGPHVEEWGRDRNHTERVIRTLKENLIQKDVKAVFFVQTHAPGRGGTPVGRDIITAVAKQGHVIAIHTGSFVDHASHKRRVAARPFDVNANEVIDGGDGANGLESDLIQAKARVHGLTGRVPAYVRPTYGERTETIKAVYERQALRMILWDIDSGDNTGSPPVDIVNRNIHEGIERCLAAGKNPLVILFHDINSQTTENLEEYLANICIAARRLGKTVVFPTSSERVIELLNTKSYE